MKILRITIIATGLLLFHTGLAQRPSVQDTSLQRALDRYLQATQHGDLEGVMDQVHPVLFEVVPRERMIDAMARAFNDPEMPMRIDTVTIDRAKGPVAQDGITYHLIAYRTVLRLHVPADSTDAGLPLSLEEQAERDEAMLSTFQAMYGRDNVSFDAVRRDHLIRTDNTMFAIKDPSLGGWKFVTNKPGMDELLDRMVPAKVRKRLGA